MLDKVSKAKLEGYMETRKRNLCRLIYITHRHFDEWGQNRWKEDGWGGLRPDHLRVLSIIGIDEVNNNELAKRARVSKQAMSKMVNDLADYGLIDINSDPNDSRAKFISVSKKGVDFMTYLKNNACDLQEHFSNLIGKK